MRCEEQGDAGVLEHSAVLVGDIVVLYGCCDNRDLHSFPTRRSSDLFIFLWSDDSEIVGVKRGTSSGAWGRLRIVLVSSHDHLNSGHGQQKTPKTPLLRYQDPLINSEQEISTTPRFSEGPTF